ncbi:MAG: hypothetical protein ACP59X_15550 [Solidesulfovibrio sp. DCME]|uniref:hypothetical protein n=1 Tax=Solidesulfovibrio sp. DCME TaxID=3447380 RepID=UPI003D0C5662
MFLLLLHTAAAIPGLTRPMLGGRFFRHVEWFLGRLARNDLFAIVITFLFALTLRVAVLPLVPPGFPVIHDEYSYLLQADTFASGHLAMPPHPLWEHFQSFHVLQHPTYASKFFPGQATFLALGQKLLGHPWWGVLLSVAAMCAALVWCLRGFLSPGYAFLGGMIAALQFATIHYWASSYWGGAVTAIGGCLAVGAVGRLLNTPDRKSGLLFGVGGVILAATRPFEGSVLSCVLLIWLMLAAWQRGRGSFPALVRTALPAMALPLALGCGGLLYFNYNVTGEAFTFPYVAYTKQYDAAYATGKPESVPFPADMPREMRRYHTEWGYPAAAQAATLRGRLASLPHRFDMLSSLLYPIFFLPAFLAPLAFFASRPTRAPALATLAVLAASLFYMWSLPHYFAPALGLFSVLWLRIFRWLRAVKLFGRPVGLSLVRLLPCVLAAVTVLGVRDYPRRQPSGNQLQAAVRQQVEARLEALPGDHLVIVTYRPDSNVHAEWVYNRADIDHARIVWARDLGPEKNAALVAYFKDRHLWCATVGAANVDFGPCPGSAPPSGQPPPPGPP